MAEVDTQNKNQKKPIIGLSQFITIGGFFAFLCLILTLAVYLFSDLLNCRVVEHCSDCPIQGENITITSFSYEWREVSSSDKVESDTLYIPEVKLSFSDSSKGKLILYFENNMQQTVGGGKSLDMSSVENTTEENPLIIYSSAGYKEKPIYKCYKYSKPPYWSLVLKEMIPGQPNKIITKLSLPPKP